MLRILHLEDRTDDAFLIQQTIADSSIEANFAVAKNRTEFLSALEQRDFDLILADNSLPGFSGLDALKIARQKCPNTGVICVSGNTSDTQVEECLKAGAIDYVVKDHLWQLVNTLRFEAERLRLLRRNRGMTLLLAAVQELSLAQNLNGLQKIVCRAARELTGADGATFALRDGDSCFYAEENAISPLWKGQRVPLAECIDGWVMLNRQPVVIEDVYQDQRVAADTYRSTFVRSMMMVPVRANDPIGAIGGYWAKPHRSPAEDVDLLQTLANAAIIAMENAETHRELERRIADRATEFDRVNRDLETLSHAVSHDLGAPLRAVRCFSDLVLKEHADKLDEPGKQCLRRVHAAGQQMSALISDLLRLSKLSKVDLRWTEVDLSRVARQAISTLAAETPGRLVEVVVTDGIKVNGDPTLLRQALENLLSNAWKHTSKTSQPRVEFGSVMQPDGAVVYHVRDNGAGFDMQYAEKKLFQPFQRLHAAEEHPGAGIGLAMVQRIIQRHGGWIRAEAAMGQGATFYFTLGQPVRPANAGLRG